MGEAARAPNSIRPAVSAGARRVGRDPEPVGGAPQQARVAERVGGGSQQQALAVARERLDAIAVALLDPARQRARVGQAAGQLGRRQAARQLEQRERVAARLGEDAVAHARVEPARRDRLQQRTRVRIGEPLDAQLRQPASSTASLGLAHREDDRDPLGQQAAGDEREHLGGGAVEPLGVVDEADERLRLGRRGEQLERPRARRGSGSARHLGGGRRRPAAPAPAAGQRRQRAGAVEQRRAQLVEAGERQLHLPWTPTTRATGQPSARSATNSSSAVLPMPASPRSASTALSVPPARAAAVGPARRTRRRRPRSIGDPARVEIGGGHAA